MKRKNIESWAESVEYSEIPALVRDSFDFLASEFHFSPPVADHIDSIVYKFSYRGKKVANEPMVDRKDGAVEVCLVRLDDGVRPDVWKIDAKGQLIMVRLYEACWHRKVPSPRANIPAGTPGRQQLELLLAAEEETLRQHFDDILHDSDALFLELNEELKKAKASASAQKIGPKGKLP